jgi:hypothetical protein
MPSLRLAELDIGLEHEHGGAGLQTRSVTKFASILTFAAISNNDNIIPQALPLLSLSPLSPPPPPSLQRWQREPHAAYAPEAGLIADSRRMRT